MYDRLQTGLRYEKKVERAVQLLNRIWKFHDTIEVVSGGDSAWVV